MAASTTAFSLAGGSYSPLHTAYTGGVPANGTYFPNSPVGTPPYETHEQKDEREIAFPGRDSFGTKNYGKRGRRIFCEMVFISTTKSNVETLKNTLFGNLESATSFSVTVPGGTPRPSCRLKRPNGIGVGEWFNPGGGKIGLKVPIVIRSAT